MTTLPTLYKRTSTGAIQQWTVAVDGNTISTMAMNTEERLEALYKLLGSCMSRDPHVRAIAQVHAARSDFDLPTCLAEMVHCLALNKERLAMDLTTAKIDQIESRMAARKAGLRRPTEYTQEIGGYDAEDAPSVNDQYTNEAIAQGR